MAIDSIRAQLVTQLGAISGVAGVVKDEANVAPSLPDLPCFVLARRDPYCTVTSVVNSDVWYTWHFDLLFLYKEAGLGNPDENISGTEDFIKLTVDALYAHFTLQTSNVLINKDTNDMQFTLGIMQKDNADANQKYWGFRATLDVTEQVETTMGT